MKKTVALLSAVVAVGTMSAYAANIGVVNMKKVFSTSPQVKQIKTDLTKRFAPQKAKLQVMGKTLQADIQKYQKNKTVMNKKQLATLESNITGQEMKFRQAQANFQHVVYAAQNKALAQFMSSVKSAVANVASQQKLDIVLPKSDILYSKNNLDLTGKVLAKMK